MFGGLHHQYVRIRFAVGTASVTGRSAPHHRGKTELPNVFLARFGVNALIKSLSLARRICGVLLLLTPAITIRRAPI
jgi:hypothetical protein